MIVLNQVSKYAHFIVLSHLYTTLSVACVFFNEVVRLHHIPCSIASDCDPVFTNTFLQELFRLSGTTFCLNSAFHLQTDGQWGSREDSRSLSPLR
jgi:hypothetical protein